ncbi:pilus assembly protein TadG-related protein [Streptomyces triticisoli]|uniref:pilus assembly protein TadG-related protein n=1 Tax=Streptomyces triticisoli TaxID=2182797 RepID=UPI000DD77787|nr:pilus assembly protein TadG-related protein [Streptomyces triticisoli]
MQRPSYDDAGQAFPIYIMVVAGLLFLAFAYFAVGQAAVNRNGAQTAADAAALAAAQDTRDQLAGKWVEAVLDPTEWQSLLDGSAAQLTGCWRAYQLAGQNEAHVDDCQPQLAALRYTVYVQSDKPIGKSTVPGVEGMRSKAHASAVIKPLCAFDPLAEGSDDKDVLPRLICKDRYWDLDPHHLMDLPRPEDLFDVHLAD